MEHWINKVVVIPNCENKVGIKIGEILVEAGMTVIGFCETNIMLEKLKISNAKYGKIFLYQCDFSNIETMQSAFDKALEIHGGVDVLINIINRENDCLVSNGDLKLIKRITDENLTGTVAWIRLAVGSMLERKSRGHIITIIEQEKPGELRSFVTSTNAAMISVNEILRHEFRYLHANIKSTYIKYCAEDFSVADAKVECVAYMAT
ncbi:Uncharacterized protein OBRU01_10923 [Operophtera brumata]|uniref:Short-chain dehydrogenase n=1 Tax=Operophtera brumata TaxID=104452 RepID=A0A0L7LDQ5_OPEBR|nr:Uncharacterized protein OBRU01_10923 [Operophtera brumata]